MTCPDPGTWRAWLDGEASIHGADAHFDGCAVCRAELEVMRDDLAFAASAVGVLAPARASTTTGAPPPAARRRSPGRWSRPAASAAAVVALVAVVATPGGRTAAASLLGAFRSDQLEVVAVNGSDLGEVMMAFEQLGTVDGTDVYTSPEPVASAAAAEDIIAASLVEVDAATLPDGVRAKPQIMATQESILRFTFDAEKTRAYLSDHGARGVDLPKGYDGAQLVVTVPGAALQEFSGRDGLPAVLVGQTRVVTADVVGNIDLARLRQFVLDLPGLPPSVVRQLQAIEDWRTTLPIPVPLDQMNAQDTTVNGADAVLVLQRGLGSGLVWQHDGRITGVAGALDEEQLRAIAAGLHTAP